jgi:hypothetical protein
VSSDTSAPPSKGSAQRQQDPHRCPCSQLSDHRITPLSASRLPRGSTLKLPFLCVHLEQMHGCSSDRRERDNVASIRCPTEVIFPAISTWVMKPHKLPAQRVERSDVGAFGTIAEATSQREVVFRGLSAMLTADDVIDVTSEEGVFLGNLAVLTTVGSSRPDCPSELCTDAGGTHGAYRAEASRRARALASRMMCSSCM